MTKKQIEFLELQGAAEDRLIFMNPPAPDAKRTGLLAAQPFGPAQSAVYWCWYQWQLDRNFQTISDRLKFITRFVSTADAAKWASKISLRGYHEWFITQCAILSGDEPTMRLACRHVAGSGGRAQQYYNSLAGMLKARIEGDQKEAERQLAFSLKYKEDGVHPMPSRALQKAFVEKDYTTLDREITRGAKRYWKDSFIGKAIIKDEPQHMVIDPVKRHSHYQWAYPEAAIATLAILDGATITYDDVWFPLDLVKSFTKPASKK
jgi:hypothetical protein